MSFQLNCFGKYHRKSHEKETKKKGDKIYLIIKKKENILKGNTHKKNKVQGIVKRLQKISKKKSKCRLKQTNKIFYARHRE